ncbi:PAS domain-containing hybrid sensor histidine kinase/response regulator [Zeimonas arvi]|uniref:histidine kinase n=1 Tax=Zeimonas arvi TaxID=2498847 RepID=A0A5C8P523_9BURK|nr:PAS domain S-box protein [Zeimonas arvi]TXL68776.1 PAS domain S-box protein [Zeimonas arvi]
MELTTEVFFENNPVPMWIYDRETLAILEVNRAAVAAYGYSRDEFLRLTIADIRPPEDVPALADVVRTGVPALSHSGVWRHRLKSGAIIHADVTSHEVAYRGRGARLVSCRDVSHQVAIERENAALLAREREVRRLAEDAADRFRTLFEAAPGAFLVLAPGTWEIVAASDAYLEATMRSRRDIVGRQLFDAFPADPADPSGDGVQKLRESLERVEATGQTDVMAIQRYPIPQPPEHGGGFVERWWSSVNTPAKAPDGAILHIIHRVTDVTEVVRGPAGDAIPDASPDSAGAVAWSLGEVLSSVRESTAASTRMRAEDGYLRLAKRMLGFGIWSLDVDTRAVQWSDNVYRIFGLGRGEFAGSWTAQLERVHPEDRDLLQASLDAFLASGRRRMDFAHRLVRPDGTIAHVRGAAELEGGQEHRRLIGVVQDITRELASESQLASTLEQISDAFYTLDECWRFSFLNGQAEKLLRRARTGLLGRVVWDEFPGAVGTTFQQQYERAVQARETVRFTEYFAPLDSWFEVVAYPTAGGLAVYFRDVTERRRAEEALRASEERFRLIARATNDVIWDWDLRAGTVWWNEAMHLVFGFRRESLEPGPESWLGRIHPDDRPRVSAGIHAAMDGVATTWADEYRFVRADGRYATVADRGFVIRDGAGKAVRMLGSMTDITERRELDERLRQSQRLEAIGQLTGGIAHDFNNLLTVIIGNSEMLCEELADQPSRKQLADMTAAAAERGAELTNRLLAFARRQPLEPRPIDVNRLVAGMDGLLRRTLSEDIEIEFVRAAGLWIAEVDGAQLESALLNLVINARDAMPDGGRLTIETGNASLDEEYAAMHGELVPGQYVMVSVSDTGTGMPPDVVARAFDPFFTTKEAGKGSGLGLSMVYGFVKQSGGHVRIYSEQGEGTTARLYLPRVKAGSIDQPAPARGAGVIGGGEHILVVEDDDLVREHLIAQLRGLGYRVTGASAGRAALAELERNADIDLLFTDVVMPGGMNGRQLADTARARWPALKVLFTSGYTENAIVHHGRLDRGVHLLSKPYRRGELAAKLRRVLDEPNRGA